MKKIPGMSAFYYDMAASWTVEGEIIAADLQDIGPCDGQRCFMSTEMDDPDG
jgi:hypothetical protein